MRRGEEERGRTEKIGSEETEETIVEQVNEEAGGKARCAGSALAIRLLILGGIY